DAYPSALRDLLPTSLDAGSSPIADVIATGRSQGFDSTEALLASYPGLASLLAELPYTSRVFVPVVGSGVPVGVLVASSGAPAHFDDEAVGLLEALAVSLWAMWRRKPWACSKRSPASAVRRSSAPRSTEMRGRQASGRPRCKRRPCRWARRTRSTMAEIHTAP